MPSRENMDRYREDLLPVCKTNYTSDAVRGCFVSDSFSSGKVREICFFFNEYDYI